MHGDARRYWAWFLSGVVLDTALAATVLFAAAALAPSLLDDRGNWIMRAVLLGFTLALAHLVLLPVLVWPRPKLTARDLSIALARVATVPPAALVGVGIGLSAGSGTFMLLVGLAFPFTEVQQSCRIGARSGRPRPNEASIAPSAIRQTRSGSGTSFGCSLPSGPGDAVPAALGPLASSAPSGLKASVEIVGPTPA